MSAVAVLAVSVVQAIHQLRMVARIYGLVGKISLFRGRELRPAAARHPQRIATEKDRALAEVSSRFEVLIARLHERIDKEILAAPGVRAPRGAQ